MVNAGENRPQKTKLVIDWSKVLTNALATLVAAVFIGAAFIVWDAAIRQTDRIDVRVKKARSDLEKTQKDLEQSQKELEQSQDMLADVQAGLQATQKALIDQITSLQDVVAGFEDQLSRLVSQLAENRDVESPADLTRDTRDERERILLRKEAAERIERAIETHTHEFRPPRS